MQNKMSTELKNFINENVNKILSNKKYAISGSYDFYKDVVAREEACIKDCISFGYRFPLEINVTSENEIRVKCKCCEKEYSFISI